MAEMSFPESPLTSQLKLADDTHEKDELLQLAYSTVRQMLLGLQCLQIAITGLTVVADCRYC